MVWAIAAIIAQKQEQWKAELSVFLCEQESDFLLFEQDLEGLHGVVVHREYRFHPG